MRHEIFDTPGFVRHNRDYARVARYRDGPKRALDIVGATVLLLVTGPLIACVWALIRMDGGPGMFSHERVGKDGETFRCLKLRTMVPGAQNVLRVYLAQNPAAMREWQMTYKLENDPRVTRIGRVLRRLSIDELPQLWNVLRGDMSLVGPRPVPREELVEYRGALREYCLLRPGITGLWQVSGRNSVAYADRVRMDRDYVWRAGLGVDLGILLRTVGAVLRRTGV